MPTRLSGLDASFLYLETATSHMHVGSVIVLDPSTSAEGQLTRDGMLAYIKRRLHLSPSFRRRLVQVPLRVHHPVWIEDPDFDLELHVRRGALASPGTMAALGAYAGDVMSRPLDRSRPLWELHVVEGLEDGRVALVTKTHHAAIDGVSGAELLAALLQLEPGQEPEPPADPWEPEPEPSDLRLLASSGLRLLGMPVGAARLTTRLLGAATSLLRSSAGGPSPPAPFSAPMTPLNGAIGAHRRVVFATMPLDDVKQVKNNLGGTVNDVILASVTGALRRFLAARGEAVDRPLVAMAPISTRADGQGGQEGSNQVSAMLVGLPVAEPDPAVRLSHITASTAGAKQQHEALGATTLQQLAQLTPAGVAALSARLYTRLHAADRHRPIWNVVVSNVPGPPLALYCADARVEAMYPLGPVHEMVGLNITVFSYQGMIFVGLNADSDLLPDADLIAEGMRGAVAELTTLSAG